MKPPKAVWVIVHGGETYHAKTEAESFVNRADALGAARGFCWILPRQPCRIVKYVRAERKKP